MLWWGWLFVGLLGFALVCRYATPLIDILHDDHYLLRLVMPDDTRIPDDYDWIKEPMAATSSEFTAPRCTLCGSPVNKYYVFDPVARAKQEVEAENLRAAVEREKARIRSRAGRSWWQRLFPYRLKFERIN